MLPPAAPASVVAVLLFTDLLDSTKWKERIGDRDYTAHLRVPHDRLFRQVLAAFPGAVERDNAGDGFLVTFRTPSDAARFAVRLHRALAAHPWHDAVVRSGHTPATRVGIHQGEVVEFDDPSGQKVSGQAVDLAARVMGLAGGGRTLLTRHAFDSARQHTFDEPLGWTAHGRYRFKGKDDDPLEVFEVGEPDRTPAPPPDGEKAKRVVIDPADDTGAWRPAVGLAVPRRDGWGLEAALGEGGFGEVWLARHKRTKESRVFKFCFDADRLRSFKRELTFFKLIQSEFGTRPDFAKLLDVQVEKPPYSLESEHVSAGDLGEWSDRRGGVGGWPLADRIRFLSAVGRAVAAAHSLGIIHKDLKPSNVLVREDGDTPHPVLADFGIGVLSDRSALAKGNVTETGFTESMMLGNDSSRTGTRLYSPPEAQTGKPATTGTDVYALGVMLFQFVAEDLHRPLGTGWADAIRTGDPDRDALLTDDITATTFADPARRLATAAEFADRLERLDARVAERKERAARAEREKQAAEQAKKLRTARRVAVAAAVATVALGALASFAWVQRNEAEQARKDEAKARGEAEAAERKADGEKVKAKQEEAKAQRTLARALLGPIQAWAPTNRFTQYESDAVWDLTELRGSPVGLMLLERAASSPLAVKQLVCRASYLDHAAVGLDSAKRQEADALFAARLRDTTLPQDHRRDVASAAAEAERFVDPDTMADSLFAALGKTEVEYEWKRLAEELASVAGAMPADKGAGVLLTSLGKVQRGYERKVFAVGLATVCDKLRVDRAAEVCGKAAEVLLVALKDDSNGPYQRKELALGFAAVARKLPTGKAADVCGKAADILLPVLGAKIGDERVKLAEGLAAVAEMIPADEWAERLLTSMSESKDSRQQMLFAGDLAKFADKLPPDRATEVCGKATKVLLAAMSTAKVYELGKLAEGLAAVAVKLPADSAAEVGVKAVELLFAAVDEAKLEHEHERNALAIGLAAVVGKSPLEQEMKVCEKVVTVLVAAREKGVSDRQELAAGLVAVSRKLPAGKGAGVLLAALQHEATGRNFGEWKELGMGLAAVADKLPDDCAAEVCDKANDLLLAELSKPTDSMREYELAAGLTAVTEKLPPEKRTEVLIAALGKMRGDSARSTVAKGMVSDAIKQTPSRGAKVLLAALFESNRHYELRVLAEGLANVSGRLPPDVGAEVCGKGVETLLHLMSQATEVEHERQVLAAGVAALVSGVSRGQLAHPFQPEPFAALTGVVTLYPAVLPKPRPLPPQQLVELLKHPFCVKEARRAVLDALEFTYDRKFADLWEFVAFAEKEHPELDLLTPPKRPQQVLPKVEKK